MTQQTPRTKRAPIPVPDFNKSDVYAVQAMARGEASPEQQIQALQWIVNNACATYDFCDRPEDSMLSAVFNGRRFAGLQIVKLTKINPTKLKE